VAAVLGHELAHHKADHIRAGHRKQQNTRVLGALLGAVVGAKVGSKHGDTAGVLTGAAVGVGAGLVALKFSRDQEMQADRLSVDWMVAAGFNPDGMLRLQSRLGDLQGKRRGAIFDTHPTSSKRFAAAEKRIAALDAEALRNRPAQGLVDDDALARADTAIRLQAEERVAEALRSNRVEPPAAALSPIEGIDFDTYAAISNELVFAGEAQRQQVLSRHRLDESRMALLNTGFTQRMRETPALGERYSAAYHRASHGPLADHGRDIADSIELARDLQLEPPYPLETAKSLLAAVMTQNAMGLQGEARRAFEAEHLAPHGLSLYDFLIGHNWWSRKARIAAMTGDTRLLSDYMGAAQGQRAGVTREQAKASGVHIGDNVRIGKGVTIGGKPVED